MRSIGAGSGASIDRQEPPQLFSHFQIQKGGGIKMDLTACSLVNPAKDIPVAGKRVLIVEDEAIVALHLKSELTKLGYVVAGIASTGEEALKLVNEAFPDAILMDIHIPGGMDGIETARQIPRYMHVPLIYLTAYSEDVTLNRAADTSPYGYLIKPFVERELHATIKMAMMRSQADEAVRENEGRLFRSLCWTPISGC
jgi:CheY-like chemotaxis protein